MALSTTGVAAVADTTKQVISLSTGVIALTVTFLEKVAEPIAASGSRDIPWTMPVAWMCLGMAVVAGILTMQALTGTLDAVDRKDAGLSLKPYQALAVTELAYGRNIIIFSVVMSVLFLFGMAFTIVTGLLLLL